MASSLSRNDSSAEEEGENKITPTQEIFPKTNVDGCSDSLDDGGHSLKAISERMNVLEEKQRQNEAESMEILPQKNDDGHSSNSLEDGGQQHLLKSILERMNVLEEKQRQNEAETTDKEMVSQQQVEHQKILLDRISELEKKQQEQEDKTYAMSDQLVKQLQNDQKAFLNRISEWEKKQQEQEEKWTNANFEQKVKQLQNDQKAFLKKIGEWGNKQQMQENNTNDRMNKLEKQQKKFDNEKKALSGKISEMEKKQQKQEEKTYALADQMESFSERMDMEKKQQQNFNNEQKVVERIGKCEVKQEEKWTKALADQMETFSDRMKKLEQKQQQKFDNEQKALLEKFDELEKQQQNLAQQMKTDSESAVNANANTARDTEEQQKRIWDKFSTLDNFNGILKDRFGNELLKAAQPEKIAEVNPASAKVFPEFRVQNFWDRFACHDDLAISIPNSALVRHRGNEKGMRTVFAKYSILHSAVDPSNIVYFELKIKKKSLIFGFAVKYPTPLNQNISNYTGIYALYNGNIWINGSEKYGNGTFDDGDTLGCGVNFASKHLFFTKNGHIFYAFPDFLLSSSPSADLLFPFVSLYYPNDKIVANFGPEFMFDFSTLLKK